MTQRGIRALEIGLLWDVGSDKRNLHRAYWICLSVIGSCPLYPQTLLGHIFLLCCCRTPVASGFPALILLQYNLSYRVFCHSGSYWKQLLLRYHPDCDDARRRWRIRGDRRARFVCFLFMRSILVFSIGLRYYPFSQLAFQGMSLC